MLSNKKKQMYIKMRSNNHIKQFNITCGEEYESYMFEYGKQEDEHSDDNHMSPNEYGKHDSI